MGADELLVDEAFAEDDAEATVDLTVVVEVDVVLVTPDAETGVEETTALTDETETETTGALLDFTTDGVSDEAPLAEDDTTGALEERELDTWFPQEPNAELQPVPQ